MGGQPAPASSTVTKLSSSSASLLSRGLVRGSQVLPPSVKEKRREEEGKGIHSEGIVRTVFLIKTVPGSAFPQLPIKRVLMGES